MSEDQHFEWLALDRPLNEQQLKEVSQLSSHMDQVTPTQAVVTYSWGDFRHKPLSVLVSYFDAFLHTAYWGVRQLAFRFPKQSIAASALEPYLMHDIITLHQEGAYVVLDLAFRPEDGGGDTWDGWVDAQGLLGRIAGVRQQLINGDYRALYIVWLAAITHPIGRAYAITDDDNADASLEPPVPAGLGSLNDSLKALCTFFEVDPYLVEAAAAMSDQAAEPSQTDVCEAISTLPHERAKDYLRRLLDDEPQLGSALRNELGLNRVGTPKREGKGRTPDELLTAAKTLAEQANLRKQAAARQARIAELETLAKREDSAWQAVDTLLQHKKASSYDAAVRELVNLRDLARHRNTETAFRARVQKIVAHYGQSRALMNRLQNAQMV